MTRRHRAAITLVAAIGATLAVAPGGAAAPALHVAPEALIRSGGARTVVDARATGRRAVLLPATGARVRGTARLRARATALTLRARANGCGGGTVAVSLDGRARGSVRVWRTRWSSLSLALSAGAGRHSVELRATAPRRRGCRRGVLLDRFTFGLAGTTPGGGTPGGGTPGGAPPGGATPPPPPPPATAGNPFAGRSLWVNDWSRARQQADAWRSGRPADAGVMDRIGAQPQVVWIGEWAPWTPDPRAETNRVITAARAAGQFPVFAIYDIPLRDCGSYSGGGAASPAAYRAFIDRIAAGVGGSASSVRAAVLLEPDALAGWTCLTAAQRGERAGLLAGAIDTLEAAGAAVYVDAGHAAWLGVADVAGRLREIGIGDAHGIALNTSNFQTTASNAAYGKQIIAALGAAGTGLGIVVDTSRNGAGAWDPGNRRRPDGSPYEYWCNPPGRALGQRPGTSTGDAALHAYLWVKVPGESDGACHTLDEAGNDYVAPGSGGYMPEYALGMARRTPGF